MEAVVVKNSTPLDDKDWINVNTAPNDMTKRYYLTENFANDILNDVPAKYRDHVITLTRFERWYRLVLEPVWQEKFNKEKRDYENLKFRCMQNW